MRVGAASKSYSCTYQGLKLPHKLMSCSHSYEPSEGGVTFTMFDDMIEMNIKMLCNGLITRFYTGGKTTGISTSANRHQLNITH